MHTWKEVHPVSIEINAAISGERKDWELFIVLGYFVCRFLRSLIRKIDNNERDE